MRQITVYKVGLYATLANLAQTKSSLPNCHNTATKYRSQ